MIQRFLNRLIWLAVLALPAMASAQTNVQTRESVGYFTNGAAVMEIFRVTTELVNTQRVRLPPHLLTNAAAATNPVIARLRTNYYSYTNLVFDGFLPNSIPYLIWTNFIAHTNGRTMRIWSERTHPANFPTNPPTVKWNTNSLIWGMKGMTALSPSWAGQGAVGQVPLTALTRRHAYARGHGMGPDGFTDKWGGRKVWFLTRDNRLLEFTTRRAVVRTGSTNGVHRDYTIFLLDRDLPNSIEPMTVTSAEEVRKYYLNHNPPPFPAQQTVVPYPIFQAEQGGNVSSSIPPLIVNTWKGGDSGSANMIPLPGELVFFSGRSTTGPTREMQADMDELCRQEGLKPARYQMRWLDWEKLVSK